MLDRMALLLKIQTLTVQLGIARARNNWLYGSIQDEREVLAAIKQWLGVPADTKIWRSDVKELLDNRIKTAIENSREMVRTF